MRRLNFERGDSVAVVLYNVDTRRIVLTKHFRYPTHGPDDGWIVEAVAGAIDHGDSPEEAARREIAEETGYDSVGTGQTATFLVSPGGSSERVILYYGEVTEGTRRGAGGGLVTEGEDIALVNLSPQQAWTAVATSEIRDAEPIIGLQRLRDRGAAE